MFSFFRQKILQCFKSFLEDETNLGGGHTKLAILFFAGDIRRGRKCGFEEEKVKSNC
jgi:hypothetical protein